MGFLNKIGKIIKAPIKVLEKVVSPVIKPVAKVIEKVVSPVSMIPGTAGKVLGGIAGINPLKGAIAGISPIAKPIVSAVNKVLPPQVTKEINRIAPDVAKDNPIVGGVKIPMQSLTEKLKTNPIVKGPLVDNRGLINSVNKQKGKLVDPDFNISRKKKIPPMKRGGLVGSSSSRAEGAMKKGGSASSRADGIAQRGKTRGRMV